MGWEYLNLSIQREIKNNLGGLTKGTVSWRWLDNNHATIPERLNELGRQNWELVSVTPIIYPSNDAPLLPVTQRIDYVFKRPLP